MSSHVTPAQRMKPFIDLGYVSLRKGGGKMQNLRLATCVLAMLVIGMSACGGDGARPRPAPGKTPGEAGVITPEPPPESVEDEPLPEPTVEPSEPPTVSAQPSQPRGRYSLDDVLRLNHIQMKGTHNSYHVRPEIYTSSAWEYDMPPFNEQAGKWGVRAFELDVHWKEGAFKVYHWEEDPGTKCPWLRDCLRQIREWSFTHPGHAPIIVFFDLKYDEGGETVFDHLQEFEWLLDEYPRDKIYTPDDLVGSYSDVQAAIQAKGWPTLRQLRGKVIFVLLAAPEVNERYANYDKGLQGRAMFASGADVGWRHAGFIVLDDVRGMEGYIRSAVEAGLIVRTRGDDMPTMGYDYPERWAIALRSGAHLILTDYPIPYSIEGHDTSIPGGRPARCNPLTAPNVCQSLAIENPELLSGPE